MARDWSADDHDAHDTIVLRTGDDRTVERVRREGAVPRLFAARHYGLMLRSWALADEEL